MKAEGTFGSTKAAHYLEDLVRGNRHDSRSVTRLICGIFKVLKEVHENTSLETFEYVSSLAIKDFERGLRESEAKYSNKDIPDIMLNVVKTKRKQLLRTKKEL